MGRRFSKSGFLSIAVILTAAGSHFFQAAHATKPASSKRASTGKVTVIPAKARNGNESLWDRLIDNFDLGDKSRPQVKAAIAEMALHRRSTRKVLSRATPFLWEITHSIESAGLPGEIALLPAIESRFNPLARSNRKAIGLWQFIPRTGYYLGLEQNWWLDARLDVTESTQAAARYLQYLHGRFDDWPLALAAYNCGEACVQRAINQANGNTDFWTLQLPQETRNYVPKLLALAEIIEEHEDYGLRLPEVPNQQTTDTVLFSKQVDLALVAKLAEVDLQTLQYLNPAFLRWATPPNGPHRLRVPAGKSKQLQSAMNALPSSRWTEWQRYIVSDGDSLGSIAQRTGIRLTDLRSINNLNSNLIRHGQMLSLPGNTLPLNVGYERFAVARGPAGAIRVEYQIRAGDSLWKIARRFRVDMVALGRWNDLSTDSILRPGKRLVVWVDQNRHLIELAGKTA